MTDMIRCVLSEIDEPIWDAVHLLPHSKSDMVRYSFFLFFFFAHHLNRGSTFLLILNVTVEAVEITHSTLKASEMPFFVNKSTMSRRVNSLHSYRCALLVYNT